MRRMRAFRILAVAAAVSLAIPAIALPVAATEKAKPYVVVMAADPIAAYAGGTRGIAATKPTAGKKVDREARPPASTSRSCRASTTARCSRAAWR
jgi:hypothetical protein